MTRHLNATIGTLRCWVTSPLVPVAGIVTAFLLGMSLIVAATGGRAFVPALVIVLAAISLWQTAVVPPRPAVRPLGGAR